MSRWRAVASAVALVAGVSVAAPASAAADPADGGLWYYTKTGVAAAHERSTGEGITIAVIDGPVNPAAPDLVGANLVVRDSFCGAPDGQTPTETATDATAEHATTIISLLVGTGAGAGGQPGVRGVAPGATVLHYSMRPPGWYEETPSQDRPDCIRPDGVADYGYPIANAIDDAVAQGARIISMSSGGLWNEPIGLAVARAHAAGAVILGAPNNDGGYAPMYPAEGNGVVMVEMADANLQLDEGSYTTSHPYMGVVAPGADILAPVPGDGSWQDYQLVWGTSYATPWTAGVLALAWSQHPEATGNQMIQALIRNTAVENEEPLHDDQWGYGPVSVSRLMDADPTTYPDENPFLRPLDDVDAVPTTRQVLAAMADARPTATAEPTPAPTPEATPAPADDSATATDAATPVVPIALGIGALLVGLVVAAVLLLRRRRTAASTATRREP
ncbi:MULTISPECIES: S8 family serine peptidase [unclassified Actinotalea]|uniref:S8 family serine peptidase n=1 Tax=unclassified Actinotalea TaxID=2638618 RepID=UPI0015F48BDE|nr:MULTISPECIES: S8 family serine peptidase [unclassified Actinotalea]